MKNYQWPLEFFSVEFSGGLGLDQRRCDMYFAGLQRGEV